MSSANPIILLAAALTLSSCHSYPYHGAHNPAYAGYSNQQRGAVTGGLAGAGIGGIVGHQSGRGLEGAAIGAGLGVLSGAILGNARDREQDLYSRGYRDGVASTGTTTSTGRVDTYQSDDHNDSYGTLPRRRYSPSTVSIGYGSGYHGGGYGSVGINRGFGWGNRYGRYGYGRRGYCW